MGLMRLLAGGLALALMVSEVMAGAPVFHAEGRPKTLAEWSQLVLEEGRLKPAPGVLAYDLNTPLFSDYAAKLRTIWMPEGVSATYREDEAFDFPVGTVITKTFYYLEAGDGVSQASAPLGLPGPDGLGLDEMRIIETRILARREEGWVAFPYIWNVEETEARLKRIGDIIPLTLVDGKGKRTDFNYVVPNVNQCAGCHATNNTTRAILPIGPKARHLNREETYAEGSLNQLEKLAEMGFLSGAPSSSETPKGAVWTDTSQSVDARARAYLDVNCAHCHNPVGPADTSGLMLLPDTPLGPALGICKPPIAAGQGTGGRKYSIVPGDPDASIMVYRMETTHPAEMMPELGRSTAHEEGVALIREWIEEMAGQCR